MKTKDFVYIGVIGFLAYLLLRKKPTSKDLETPTSTTNDSPVGNSSNGGMNLGSNMDLPNLTPTPTDGLSTEVALSSSNVSPLIKEDNEPTQIFGSINLPPPYMSTSIVNPSPVDVVPAPSNIIKAEIATIQPDMGNAIPIVEDLSDELILECGDSFSIANDDKEGSYSNYWFDGKEYYTQTTSPLIKSFPVKITKKIYVEACKKLQELKMNNGKR